jgi:acyl-[acyl-carrier-protein] desaturase
LSHIEPFIISEIEKDKSSFPPSLLSRAEKDRLVQRAFHGLYRWYLDRSQANRAWSPDRSFAWGALGRNHSPELLAIIEGFYAIEQYAPDYTSELTRLTRKSYGRSQFQLRWGSEEEKHSDLWRNTLLFSRARTPVWLEQYTADLRENSWTLPFDDPLRMILYTVFQERATQLSYLVLLKIARGQSPKPQFAGDADPVLARACSTIAIDEAAHFDFFLEGARLMLYYYPEETLEALVDVLRGFMMPGHNLLPDYDALVKTIYDGGVFSRRMHSRDVVQVALKNLGIESLRAIEAGVARRRQVPDEDGRIRDTALFQEVDFSVVESSVERLFARVGGFEAEVGLADVNPTRFVKNTWTI